MDDRSARTVEAVVRGIATAAKTLRLYPPSSPIPRQSAESAAVAVAECLERFPVLSLTVGRESLMVDGKPVGAGSVGGSDLVSELRSHGVAEVELLRGADVEQLLAFLSLVSRPAEDVGSEGGLPALLAAAGVESVRVSEVELTLADKACQEDVADIDEFLKDLASEPEKLAAWLDGVAEGDLAALEEGLAELRAAAGSDGVIARSLALVFESAEGGGADALIGAAMNDGVARDLTGQALGLVSEDMIAHALATGAYGQNMLSLSSALTRLPLADKMSGVFAEVRKLIELHGRESREIEFLEHMVEVRDSSLPERPLADDIAYRRTLLATAVSGEEVGRAREEVARSSGLSNRSIEMMLALLDQQRDVDLYCRAAEGLASAVPSLVERGDLKLAKRVLAELGSRQMRSEQPWPGLEERLRAILAQAASRAAMHALLVSVMEDEKRVTDAREMVRLAGERACERLIEEAAGLKEEGLAAAEAIVGRRALDHLAALSSGLHWYLVGPVARRLAEENDVRCESALRSLTSREDDQSRREAARGLAGAGSAGIRPLSALLRDPSVEVQIVAARGLAKCGGSEAAGCLASRLGELDLDGKDFLVGRELIGALARVPGREAREALKRLSSRKAFIKRGHFVEVQQLARQALQVQARAGEAS